MAADPSDSLAYARRLLREGETEVPSAVRATLDFLDTRGVWYQLSRNEPATSCRDAAHKRHRLGHVGIPLRDEMKSFFGKARAHDGQVRYVMAHCRGDRLLDLDRLAACIGVEERPQRLDDEDIGQLGLRYGLVNPFETWTPYALDGRFLHAPVLQVFDDDLLDRLGCPGTSMTNAGDLTWAVEFFARELFEAIRATSHPFEDPRALVGKISLRDASAPHRPGSLASRRSIAIITGNAPESGISLWQRINSYARDLLGADNTGDVAMPAMQVISLPEMGMTMELDRREDHVWARLEPEIERICLTDAAILAIACNTTQYFVDRVRAICEPHDVEFVCLPEVVAAWLRSQRVEEVALVGIPYVADVAAGYSAYARPLADFKLEIPSPETFARLTELAYSVKETGPNERGLTHLRNILARGVESSYIVLALTELSILLERQKKAGRSGKTIIDPVELYAEALARRWQDLPFPPPPARWIVDATGFTSPGQRVAEGTGRPHNEDALMLGTRVITGPASDRSPNAVYQERIQLERHRDGAIIGVADGLGGNPAGELASAYVLHRLAESAAQPADVAPLSATIHRISDGLRDEGERAGEHYGETRGTTLAGMRIILEAEEGRDDDLRLTVRWFSVGDCVILMLAGGDNTDEATLSLVSTPDVKPDGHPSAVVGLSGLDVREGVIRPAGAAILLCATDGLISSFGYSVADPRLAAQLQDDPRLKDFWVRLAREAGEPPADRRAIGELFEIAGSSWPGDGHDRADNVTVALVRIERSA